ncbi:MAG: riboflavin synthase [Thermodesulfovibrio sp.]|nr:riboflavin synthase [Thermodesulfovibrio sp.]
MFTGLIIELGEIVSLEKKSDNVKLYVKADEIIKDVAIGDSIAINGICLTVVTVEKDILSFDVSYETMKSTNLGHLKKGDRVNLEPSLRPTSKLGGHFVTGHVDGVGKIRSKTPAGNAVKFEIESPENVLRYLVEKGSIAIDGISLTVVNVLRDAFSVVIIPHTAKMTTMGFKKAGDTVNLEPDILAKYVAKFLQTDKDSSLLSALKQSGFIP